MILGYVGKDCGFYSYILSRDKEELMLLSWSEDDDIMSFEFYCSTYEVDIAYFGFYML